MGVRTTITLDEDVLERVKRESQNRGRTFRETLNELVRLGLASSAAKPRRTPLRIRATDMGVRPGLNYDCIGSLLEYAEGPEHR